jgi:pectinesterase
LPEQIAPEGLNNWGNPENEQTTLYAAYNNTGKGAVTAKLFPWAKILTEKEAMAYTLENIFAPTGLAESGNAWFLNLKTGRFVWPGLKNLGFGMVYVPTNHSA